MLRLASRGALTFLSLGVAAYVLYLYLARPLGAHLAPAMRLNFELHKPGIYAHIFGAAVALVLGPFQFSRRLRAARPRLHRWMGRSYLLAGVGVGGVAGMYMATLAYGGIAGRLGFGALAVLWLYTGWQAYAAARARNVKAHQNWMLRNFALTFAAVTLRLYIVLGFSAQWPFEQTYPAIAWLCWVPNLLIAEAFLVKR